MSLDHYRLKCLGSGRGDCGKEFDSIEEAANHPCEDDDEGPEYVILV